MENTMPAPASTPAAEPRRVATYISSRPSRDDEPGPGVARQEATLRTYLATRTDWHLVAAYHDEGDPRRRPALAHALADARSGRFDLLLVTAPERLSRRIRTLATCLHGFTDAGVAVGSADGGLDTSTPAGRLAVAVLTACAQFETDAPGTYRRLLAAQTAASTTGTGAAGTNPGRGRRHTRRQANPPHTRHPSTADTPPTRG
jgi:DNA invertase Pin-like site-specific DNA recombinase